MSITVTSLSEGVVARLGKRAFGQSLHTVPTAGRDPEIK